VNPLHITVIERMSARAQAFGLSNRQRQCLILAAQGKKQVTIGEELKISHHTVSFHLCVAYRKMGASNITAAIVLLLGQAKESPIYRYSPQGD